MEIKELSKWKRYAGEGNYKRYGQQVKRDQLEKSYFLKSAMIQM